MNIIKSKLMDLLRGNILNIILVIAILISVAGIVGFTVWGNTAINNANRAGETVGEITGNFVGAAIGSFNGITVGLSEGKEAGIEAGLSAEDTTVDIKGQIKKIGKLEILSAGVELKNDHTVGTTYAALYILKGKVLFTVDLSQINIEYNEDNNDIIIFIPLPELDIRLDENETKKIAEYQKPLFNGDAAAGFEAYINSMSVTAENAKEVISNYDTLNEQAKEAAIKQTKMLAEKMCGNNKSVQVKFLGEGR